MPRKRLLRLGPSRVITDFEDLLVCLKVYKSLWQGNKAEGHTSPSCWLCNRPFWQVVTMLNRGALWTPTPVINDKTSQARTRWQRRSTGVRRLIVRVIDWKPPKYGHYSTVQFECGHEGTSWSRNLVPMDDAGTPIKATHGRCVDCRTRKELSLAI